MLPAKPMPKITTTALAAITATALALGSAAPAQALGKNERKFLQGVAAALIVTTILNQQRGNAAPAPLPRQPVHAPPPRQDWSHNAPHHYDPPRHTRPTGSVIGSPHHQQSIHASHAARSFNSYAPSERRAIQSRLRAYGYYHGSIDGVFGPATFRALQAYARDTGGESQLATIGGSYGVLDGLLA
ncbi:MAG: peptidoglycan-binding protein [Cypionkella sp.]|nr:peptidoglycan-binding protein [Cypionkella sp.]